jgi:hypothetical protein
VTSWRWQERRLGGGKRDILEVARETSWTWQELRGKGTLTFAKILAISIFKSISSVLGKVG